MNKKSILFVCTGNIFRSMRAEYLLKKYLKDNKITGWKVGSAGTIARFEPAQKKVIKVLAESGISIKGHKQRKLTKDIIDEYNIIVALAKDHYDLIKANYKHDNVYLFNELATKKKTSIWDLEDDVPDFRTNKKAVDEKLERTVRFISDNIPGLFENAAKLLDD